MTEEFKPLSAAQMKVAKRTWPRKNNFCHPTISGGLTLESFIKEFNELVPEEYRKTAVIDCDHEEYYGSSRGWIEVQYNEDETDAEWEARITKLYRWKQETTKRERKRLAALKKDHEFKTYQRLKAKFEGQS